MHPPFAFSRLLLLSILVAVSTFGSGCAVRKVQYELKDVVAVPDSPWREYSVTVAELKDQRDARLMQAHGKSNLEPAIVDVDPSKEDAKEGFWLNSLEHYHEPTLRGASNMLRLHLEASHLFRAVVKDATGADLVLSGTLRKLEGRRQRKSMAEFFAHNGGLLTMPIALATDANYSGDTEMELELRRAGTGEVLWKSTIRGELRGKNSVGNSPWAVYEHANIAFRDAVRKLVAELRAAQPANAVASVTPAATGGAAATGSLKPEPAATVTATAPAAP